MNRKKSSIKLQRCRYVLSDYTSSAVAFVAFNVCRFHLLKETGSLESFLLQDKLIAEALLVPAVMVGVYWLSGFYNHPFGKSRLQELFTTLFSSLFNTLWIFLVLLINDQTGSRSVNYELIAYLISLTFALPYLGRLAITDYSIRRFRESKWVYKVIVVGNSKTARARGESLAKSRSRIRRTILGYVDIAGETPAGCSLGPMAEINGIVAESKPDELILVTEHYDEQKVLNILYHLFPLGLPIKIAPDTLSYVTSAIRLKDIFGEPMVDLTSPAMSESSKNIKRVCDVLISIFSLVFFSPLMAAVAICIKRGSPGPVIYSQERIGRLQKPFRIFKFRTMREGAEEGQPRLSSDNDQRVTPFGRFLRKYRIDELPQFWNVLKGEMSVVGPRPEREYFIRQIIERAPYYTLVYQVRPGITSWGMVKYGYATNVGQMVVRTRYDLIYLGNMSLFVDIKILIYTIKTVALGKGM